MASEVTVSAEAESAEASTLKPSEDVADERPGTPVEDEKNANDASGDAAAEDEDDSDEEENVNVVIKSNAATAPIGMVAAAQQSVTGQSAPGGAGPVFKGGVGQLSGIGTRVVQLKTGGVELDLIPSVNGVLLTEMDLETLEDKPWRLPGADISDYFNYGFNEETWGSYCSKQKLLRAESTARGLVVGNKLMSGNTVDHNAPKMIQTISRTDNFSEEQKNLLGLTSSVQSSVGDSIHHVNVISSISSTNGMPHNSIPKLNNDPGAMLPPPFMPPGMPPMPPPFGLPFPGMPGGPGGFPGMPPGFPAFPPAAAIPNKMPENEIEFKTEPLSSPPDVYEQDRDDDIQMTKEHKRRDRERDHSPRERESRKRHHRDRDRSEEKGGGGGSGRRSGRGRHNSEEDPGASDEKAGRSYKRSSKKHHKEHYRERDYRSRSRDRTPTNDE